MTEIKTRPIPQRRERTASERTASERTASERTASERTASEQTASERTVAVSPYAQRPRPFFARHPRLGYAIFYFAFLTFLVITALVLADSPRTAWDAQLGLSVRDWAARQSTGVELFMRFFSTYGRDGVALMMFILAVGWLRKGARRELWMLFFGVLGAHLWFHILTNLIGRTRPEYRDPHETLLGAGFPSGHAATSVVMGMMILYLILPHLRKPLHRALLVAGVVITITLIVFSRLFLSMHYPTDLIAGVVLGIGWGALIFTITDTYFWRAADPAVQPYDRE